MARENDPTHLSPKFNSASKNPNFVSSWRRDRQREVPSSEGQQGIRKVVDKRIDTVRGTIAGLCQRGSK